MFQKGRKQIDSSWIDLGKVLVLTFAAVLIIEFVLYFLGARGTNIARMLLGKPLYR